MESYLSLRQLESDVLKELFDGQIQIGEFINPIKVSIVAGIASPQIL
ncbi:MAG: hypothetical protein IKN16_07725 [Selenomonadaceae bacterium]|nr:hypothetical protein [Selenomonadaceae bacterium]MBR6888319.1 hypothetical protein [Selenomonadaceae bacterium]